MDALRATKAAFVFALGFGAAAAIPPAARADQGADAAASAHNRVVMMQRFIVSATRIEKNPWRYASVSGFEILTRASEEETDWELDALRRGLWLQNVVMPKDWHPQSPVPCTVIMDDTDLNAVPTGQIHSQPIVFHSPDDALTWGQLSDRVDLSTDPVTSFDSDAFAINSNLYGVDTDKPAYGSMSLERVYRAAPPLPKWLISGLLGPRTGIFRESFALFVGSDQGGTAGFSTPWIRGAEGPGTLWVSLDETQRLLKKLRKDKKAKIAVPSLGALFAESTPPDGSRALWESEAGLFVRWGLMGPGHKDPATSAAFLELVRRARREPVTERVFTECFGFGYAAMEEKLGAFLRTVLAQPTSVDLDMPQDFPEPNLQSATADQIGRILGDWLRMQGNSLRSQDPDLSAEFLDSAGRMLLRAYRDDNGLPPDVDPGREGGRSASSSPNSGYGSAVVMKPFVVAASHIHDPLLLAVYGLYEHDMGNDGKAREFLEAAVRAEAVRPRAYYLLAELRYRDAIAIPLGSQGRFSAQQAASILEPLQNSLRYPPESDVYRLIVETWIHCDARPSDRDIEGIVEGAALFPRNTGLTYRSAAVCAQEGYSAQAAGLIDRGLVLAMDESTRDYFMRLRSTLAEPRPGVSN
jgi:hypothetical protein